MNQDNIISKRNSQIYLYFYLAYVILTTISKFSAYYSYLHFLYEGVVILSIPINVIFLFILNNNDIKSSIYGYILSTLIIFSLIFNLITKLQVMTVPLAAIYLFIINLRYVNLNKFIKSDLKIKLSLLFLIILLYLFHLCPSSSYFIEYRNGIPRFSMGFAVYTMFSSFVFCIILSYIILLGKKILHIKYLICIFIISLGVFLLTDSRGTFISEMIVIVMLFLLRVNIFKIILKIFSIPILLFISILAVLIPLKTSIGTPSFYYWNKLFSNRLVLQQSALDAYPIKEFGYDHIPLLIGGNRIYIDNTYLMLILACGIIGFVIFVYLLIRCCYLSIRHDNYILCSLLIALAILFINEIYFNDINVYTPIITSCILGVQVNRNKITNSKKSGR